VLYPGNFEFLYKLDFVSIAQFLRVSVPYVFSMLCKTFHYLLEHEST
jgi:hypothetical protein